MRRLILLTALCAMVLSGLGCPKRVPASPPPLDAEDALQKALTELEANRYAQAEEKLTFLIFNYPGSRQASDAQYYLADAYLRSGDYIQAQTEFDFYLKSFPNGRFQEEATYKLALAYLRSAPGHARDQSRAMKAREVIDEFSASYPESRFAPQAESVKAEIEQRLAAKEFDAARLYYKSGEFRSALAYYQYVLDHHPAASWSGRDRFQLGVCLQETGAVEKAQAVFQEILDGSYDAATKQLARDRIARIK